MNTPLVSIILPVYNGEQFLESSIKSCLSQTHENLELLIVDDCSTDSTSKIANCYVKIDKRVKYFRNYENLRLPRSLNVGFDQAKGEYLTWTSDDNILHQNFVESMLSELKNKKCDLVYSRYNQIDSNNKVIGISSLHNPNLLIRKNVVGASFLYKKDIHVTLSGYNTSLFLVEDYDFWLRAAEQYVFCRLDKVLFDYRVHDKSLTSSRKKEILNLTVKLRWKYMFSKRYTFKDKLMSIAISYFDLLRFYITNKKG